MKRWLHQFALLVAAFTLLTVLAGAWLTSARAAAHVPAIIEQIHLGTAVVTAAFIVGLSVCLIFAKWRTLGWLLLAAVIAEGGLAQVSPVGHAIMAQLLVAITATAAVCTSKSWSLEPETVMDHGWPSMRSLGVATPVLVLAQVILGAAFRHKVAGLTWHIVGAMVVALTVLIVGMCAMQAYPKHPTLRPAALALLCIALAQVFLGIATITTEMMAPDNTVPFSVILATMGHVAFGSATLAASLILAVEIRRNVQKPVEEPEEEQTAASV